MPRSVLERPDGAANGRHAWRLTGTDRPRARPLAKSDELRKDFDVVLAAVKSPRLSPMNARSDTIRAEAHVNFITSITQG